MPLISALIAKEFETWLRDRATFVVFTVLVLLSSLLVLVLSVVTVAPPANAAPALLSGASATTSALDPLATHRGLLLFGGVALCVALVAVVVAPTVAASAFAYERDRGTLDLLLLQGPSALHVVVAKAAAALGFSLLLLLVTVPFFAPAWAFGGVDPLQALELLAILVLLTFFCTALGLFCAALVRGTLLAAAFAQGIGLLLLLGTLGAASVVLAANGPSAAVVPLQSVNPVVAIVSAGGPTARAVLRGAPVFVRRLLAVGGAPGAPQPAGAPDWALACLIWLVLGSLLVVAASITLDPCHPLRAAWRGQTR